MISYSKTDKQTRYKFNIFTDYEDVELQKTLHLFRIVIDKQFYYNKSTVEDCIYLINRMLSTLNLIEDDRIEMERKILYHLSKHIMLSDNGKHKQYNIKDVHLKEWL